MVRTDKISASEYEDKLRACWTGKNIGGALGAPFEGVVGPLCLDGFDPAPDRPLPNDDLELQLVWLLLAEENGLALGWEHFTKAWKDQIKYGMDEYGVAIWNIRRGLKPPLTGLHNNWFVDGMGAAIRSEIWACLFPGRPEMAAHFARLDASVDHSGDGVWAEMFLAAAENAAFTATDISEALQAGLAVIPQNCRIARAVGQVIESCRDTVDCAKLREQILRDFGSGNFSDCVMNVAFIVMALLTGKNDFGNVILTAVNCGHDTDCTGAASGAFWGILHGTKGIGEKWRNSVGDKITYSDFLQGLGLPETIDELTGRIVKLSSEMTGCCDKGFVPDISVLPDEDHINDGYKWLIMPADDDIWSAPARITAVETGNQDFTSLATESAGIHLNVASCCNLPQTAIYFFSYLKVPVDVDAFLLLCADTGMTAWLDGEQILNYHGRKRAIPACHRVEGGGAVPVKLSANRSYALRIRLLFCRDPLTMTVAVLDKNNQYVPGFEFNAKP